MLIANRYEFQEQIGAGGMGVVFRGVDTVSGETVAIKRLKGEAATQDAELLKRFQREAEALRQLNHPDIVKVLATVEQDNQHFIIMEYMEGGTLRELLTSPPGPLSVSVNREGEKTILLPIHRILSIALDLADALTRAHRLNIIHRDLKPANVLIAAYGSPRLTDFGVAHMGGMERMTESDSVMGTPDYLPPEMLTGVGLDSRGDIWSFGVMLFEMIAGVRPFSGSSIGQVLTAILTHPTPDLEALRPDAPVGLVDLVYRMMEKDREVRISSVRLVGAELEAILAGKNAGAKASSPAAPPPPVENGVTTLGVKRFETPPTRVNPLIKHNLPAQTTPFVGRETELGQLVSLLNDAAVRLVTILAPGGMGKTRLALEVGQSIVSPSPLRGEGNNAYENGVYFVPLAPLTSADDMVRAVAEAVTFQFYPGGEPRQELLDFFREKHILLLMDNFEHLLDGVGLVQDILQSAPGVRIIATSRQRLNLSGEHSLNLGGMDYAGWKTLDEALEYSAVKLFVQSAKRIRPGFELKADDLPYIERICGVVEGMPLGILLAAAWVETLTVKEIAEEIGMSLDFLETNMRDIPTRQRSIRAVFGYSWTLLSEDERIVFSKLSVFRGGFTREAAEAVAEAGLRQLTGLVSKSLLRRNPDSGRYEIHELLRQYGEDQLHQHGQAAWEAHSGYFATFMQKREADLKGRRQQEALQEIETEFDNIRQAWFYTVQQAQLERLDQFTYALNLAAYLRKRHSELIGMAAYGVEILGSSFSDQRNFGRLLVLHGQCLEGLGQLEYAEKQLRQALAIAQVKQDTFGIAQASVWLARAIDPDLAKRAEVWALCETSLRIFKEVRDEYELANALHYQGYLLWSEVKHNESLELNRQVLEMRRRLGDDIGTAASLYNIVGSLYFTNPAEAETQCKEVLALYRRLNQPYGAAGSLSRLASIELYKGNLETARSYAEEALQLARENGVAFAVSDVLVQLAWISVALDQFREAEETINRDSSTEDSGMLAEHTLIRGFIHMGLKEWDAAKHKLITYLQLGESPITSEEPTAVLGLGVIAAAQGQAERGLELISWVQNNAKLTTYRKQMPLVLRALETIKTQMSETDYDAAWERGKTLNLEAVVAEVLKDN